MESRTRSIYSNVRHTYVSYCIDHGEEFFRNEMWSPGTEQCFEGRESNHSSYFMMQIVFTDFVSKCVGTN